MTYRTEQDKINRREANQRYYRMEENKEQKRDYMKTYRKRKILEKETLEINNNNLNAINSDRFVNDAKKSQK
jgi:hypothetical protein